MSARNLTGYSRQRYSFDVLGKLQRIVAFLASVSVILGVYSFFNDIQASREARLVTAWQLLTTPAMGNTGKIGALELIAASGQPLVDIDLGCIVEESSVRTAACHRGVYLKGAKLPGADLSGARLTGANMAGADLRNATLDRAHMALMDLSGARLDNASLQAVSFTLSSLEGTSLQGADLAGARFAFTNVSGADFSGATGIRATHADDLWAWEDRPPKGLAADLVRLCPRGLALHTDFTDRFRTPPGC